MRKRSLIPSILEEDGLPYTGRYAANVITENMEFVSNLSIDPERRKQVITGSTKFIQEKKVTWPL